MKAIRLKMAAGALALWLAGGHTVPAFAQQIDPALAGAVTAQTLELKSLHDKRRKTQEKIIAAEAAVTVALDRVHSVENKMLEYLSNAQGAVQNLYQIKRAGELVTTEIPQNCNLLLKSVGSNLKGTAIAAIVSDELTDAATQMAALYPFMKQLVTSGSYDVTGADGKNEKHKVNLLDSSERYYIANEVVTKLETINRPVHPGLAGAHALVERPLVLARPGRMGQCDVRQEHYRRHRGRLEAWIQLGFYHQNSVP